MVRSTTYILLATLFVPGWITSEAPQIPLGSGSDIPVEILFSGVTPFDTGASALIKIQDTPIENISSPCEDRTTVLTNDTTSMVLQWRPEGRCLVPIITIEDKNYILPINGYYPDEISLSDISNETLKNTLQAGMLLRTDPRISSIRVRNFFGSIEKILKARSTKFSLPIPESPVPTNASHLPNAARPFRAKMTDGIHHGWDFYVREGTPVRAIEEGTIIHVKRDFSWDEMNHLHPGETDLEEQENLDTYRGNTVYLKTRSGHVAIYAHLSNIPDDILIGQVVTRGRILGHVGDSAVPDKKYLYHLHFELAMNPLLDNKAGTYAFEDILLWSFWGKGKSIDWIRQNDDKLFE